MKTPPFTLLARAWPPGTVKFVKVLYVVETAHRGRTLRLIACLEPGNRDESFILDSRNSPSAADAQEGEAGKITFTPDEGPGHWHYERIERAD